MTVIAGRGTFSYDAETGLLTENAGVSFSSVPSSFPDMQPFTVPGWFEWSVKVDEEGAVLEKGSAAMYWDLGSGPLQVLTGEVIDLGSLGDYSCSPPDVVPQQCMWDSPMVSIRVTYENPAVRALAGISLGNWLTYRSSFELFGDVPLLSESFTCQRETNCRPYTFDVVSGYQVAEPTTLGLLALGLAGLALARRRARSC
jgi:hypothetical protein